jgi:hypothetical protein
VEVGCACSGSAEARPLLTGLAKLREEGLTAAGVVVAFHKRSVLPLVQCPLFVYQMTPKTSLVGTWMRDEPISAVEIKLGVVRIVVTELSKDFQSIRMRLEEGYVSLLSVFFCSLVSF